jgi:DNA-binding MarR family transcriptional regulator
MPAARTSQQEIECALHVLASRDSMELIYRRLAARAGVDLDPLSTWLLFRLQERVPISEAELAQRLRVPQDRLSPAIEQLTQKGLVSATSQADGQSSGQLQLTAAGQQAIDKLHDAYHDSLAELLDGWSPEQEEELARLLRRLATRLLSEDSGKKSTKELVGAAS